MNARGVRFASRARALALPVLVLLVAVATGGCAAFPREQAGGANGDGGRAAPSAVFVGDSETVGWLGQVAGVHATGHWTLGQVVHGVRMEEGWARNGARTADMAEGVRSPAIRPDVLVAMGGTNDLTHGVTPRQTLLHLDGVSQTVSAPRRILLAIPPMSNRVRQAVEFDEELRQLATAGGWEVFDPWQGMRVGGDWAGHYRGDGVHPNQAGFEKVGRAILEHVAQTVTPEASESAVPSQFAGGRAYPYGDQLRHGSPAHDGSLASDGSRARPHGDDGEGGLAT